MAVEEARTSALVLWLVNTGADFAWWATEKIAPSILIRFVGVSPQQAEQKRVMQIVRSIEPLSRRFPGINIDSKLPAAELAASTIPNAKLVVYETGGHLLVGRQQEVRAVIRDILAKQGHESASSG